MLKHLSFALLFLIAMFTITGCGGPEKPAGAPEAEIEVWAQMTGIGTSDKDIAAVTGVPKAEVDKVYQNTKAALAESFQKSYVLTQENAEMLADYWMDTLVADQTITAKLKTASDTEPVVELTFTPISQEGVTELIRSNNDLLQFMQTLEQVKADPAETQNALNNDELQNIILQVMETKIVDAFPYKDPVTMDVKCRIVQGEDGKTHWGPADPNAVANFLKQ